MYLKILDIYFDRSLRISLNFIKHLGDFANNFIKVVDDLEDNFSLYNIPFMNMVYVLKLFLSPRKVAYKIC